MSKDIEMEITTLTSVMVPEGSKIELGAGGRGHASILLPSGKRIKSFVIFEIDEEELDEAELAEHGIFAEDLSRDIEEK